MILHASQLPSDVDALRQLVLTQQAKLAQQDTQVLHLSAWVEKLKLQIAALKRLRFGKSSEQLDRQIAQLELIVEDLQVQQAPVDSGLPHQDPQSASAPAAAPQPTAPEPLQRPRKLLAQHLPREPVLHAAPCACPVCGSSKLRQVGQDISEQLEFVPEHFKVIRHIRPKLSCAACQTMVQAPAPSRPIAKSPVGAGLLAHVLVSKYADHLPLYRQSAIYARQGVELERSTLADWVGGASTLLQPLVGAIRSHVLEAAKLHGDDTPVPVLAPGHSPARAGSTSSATATAATTKTGRLWAYVRDDRPAGDTTAAAVWFAYSRDRKGIHPQTHLQHFAGILQADGYGGFNALYQGGKVIEAACWAHARRKFYELAQATGSPKAKEALAHIQQLYAIEQAIRGQSAEERWRVRQASARPLLDTLHRWMLASLAQTSAKSPLAQAIGYSLKRWVALTRYAQDGRIEIDNNAVERQIRPVALGRKNYLFAGSDEGGHRAAAMYTLLGCAKLHGLNPEAYLRHVLTHIAAHPINRVSELLPWNVAAQLTATGASADLQQAA